MGSITISNVDDNLKQQLKLRADKHGHSIEAEACDILRSALRASGSETNPAPQHVAVAIRAIVEPLGGINLEIAPRKSVREAPRFD